MSLKSYSKERAKNMPGLALANKFLIRFMKYKYHLPHNITTNNTIKTHSLTLFKWHHYGRSGYYDSKFNGYVLAAWMNRYSIIRGYKIDVLLENIPEFYHIALRYYLLSLDDIYNYFIDNDLDYKDNKLCYDLINALVNRFYHYKYLCRDIAANMKEALTLKLDYKYKKNSVPKYHQYHQVQRVHNAYIPRYNPQTNQRYRYPLYRTYSQIYYHV